MMKNRTRPVRIEFRVTEQERQLIQKKMEQLGTKNMGAYLRKMAIDGYIIKVKLQIRNTRRICCRGSRPDKPEASEDSPASAATTTMETAFCWTMAIPASVRRQYPTV